MPRRRELPDAGVLLTQLPVEIASRRVLHLGSGRKYADDAVNVDLVASTHPDIVHDLNARPWPFPDDHFREVRAYDVIEHLDSIISAMEEIHRVCANGAHVHITVPHFSCVNAFTDPTHRHFFSSESFSYFTADGSFSFYTTKRYRVLTASIVFLPTLLNKIVHRLARRWPQEYERRWAWTFPAWFLSFELEVVKTHPSS